MPRMHNFGYTQANFGDDLNLWLWPKLLPDFLDDSEEELFLGIGTVINHFVPEEPVKIVLGSGVGYGRLPKTDPSLWTFYGVRGPLSAKALGLPPSFILGDPATLIRTMPLPEARRSHPVSFMPHWESALVGRWKDACDAAGIHHIDPAAPVEDVLADLRGTDLIITEAMHGAIVADALRIPWIAVSPLLGMHAHKWNDWAGSLNIAYQPVQGQASSCAEFYRAAYRRLRSAAGRSMRRDGAAPDHGPGPSLPNLHMPEAGAERRARALGLLEACVERPAAASFRALSRAGLADRLDEPFIDSAAKHLRALSRLRPSLSGNANIDRATERLLQAVGALRSDKAAGWADRRTADRRTRAIH